jgi:imidazolonepropionase-like amidohydrolase
MKWAIHARRLFDGTGKPLVQDALMVIENQRISAVGPASQGPLPADVPVLEVGDRTVLPGLIDAHVHMLFTGGALSGQESRHATDSQALLTGARNAQLALQSGLTTVRDCGDRNYLSLVLRDYINSGGLPGPRLVCSGPVITTTAGQLWWNGLECDTDDELRRAVRTLVKNGVDFVKLMGSGGNATPGSNPEVSQYPATGFRAVADDAHRMGKMVAAHVHGIDSMALAAEAGIDTLEHCPFRAHGTIKYQEQIVDKIINKGLIVSLAMPATWYRLRVEDMQDVRAHPGHLWPERYDTIRKMHAAGVKLVVSSDQGSTGTRIDELHLLMAFLVETIKMPAAEVLYGVTGLAAQAVGMADRLGTLAPGKLADIVVVDGNPLTDMTTMGRMHMVIKDGQILGRDGALWWPASDPIHHLRTSGA